MSDSHDQDSKTEAPSEKRVRDSVEKGQAPASRELSTLCLFASLWLCLGWFTHATAVKVSGFSSRILDNLDTIGLQNAEDATTLLAAASLDIFWATLLLMVVISASSSLPFIVQSRRFLVLNRVAPELSRLSIVSGLARLFGSASLKEFFKSLLKLALLLSLGYHIITAYWSHIVILVQKETVLLMANLVGLASQLVGLCCLIYIVIAAIDLLLVNRDWLMKLRMTKQEVKDEVKENDGDPFLNARRRALARSRSRQRLKVDVPRATVIVTNPTHISVALRYVEAETRAPVVVAKGADHIALLIRSIATTHNIPIMENPPLARELFARATVDREIPHEHYRAVADLLILLRRHHVRKR